MVLPNTQGFPILVSLTQTKPLTPAMHTVAGLWFYALSASIHSRREHRVVILIQSDDDGRLMEKEKTPPPKIRLLRHAWDTV